MTDLSQLLDLRDKLDKAPGTTWDANPWVAALMFTAVLGNIDVKEG